MALAALVGGVVLYLLGHVISSGSRCTPFPQYAWRLQLCCCDDSVIAGQPALVQLAVVTFVVTCAVLVESVISAESRRKIQAELARH